MLNFIRARGNSVFAIHNTDCVKLSNPLRLNFIHLNEYKFRNHLKTFSVDNLLNILLYGAEKFTYRVNEEILKHERSFEIDILKFYHFSEPQFYS